MKQTGAWITGNIVVGFIGFFAYLWGILLTWGGEGMNWLYPIGAVAAVLLIFAVLNSLLISGDKAKYWGLSIVILLASTGVTAVVYGILQNTIFE